MSSTPAGGFGTRVYFLPDDGMTPKAAQILTGSGYVTVAIKGAHYRSAGNLWQKIFGGSDKVTLSTQVTHVVNGEANNPTGQSIEDVRQVQSGQASYFGNTRNLAVNLPNDCDAINVTATISAIENDNLSGALNILNSGELKSTLGLAPAAVSDAFAIANVVKTLLTNTNPQNKLQAEYDGVLTSTPSNDPIGNNRLAQGTLIFLYRESADDTSLDNLDPTKLAVDGDGLKYQGNAVQNTYVMLQISFTDSRTEDSASPWYSAFGTASDTLDSLITATTDTDKQKIIASAYATYQQGVKLLKADLTYTQAQQQGIAAKYLTVLQQKSGQTKPAAAALGSNLLRGSQAASVDGALADPVNIASQYMAKLARANVSLAAPFNRSASFQSTGQACADQIFYGITPDKWQSIVTQAAAKNIRISGSTGQASYDGVTIRWNYDAGGQSLTLTCLAKPFILPCSYVQGQIQSLVQSVVNPVGSSASELAVSSR